MSVGSYSAANLDGFKKRNNFRLKDGSNIYRVLPPFGSLALSDRPRISQYWDLIWVKANGKWSPFPVLEKTKGRGRDKVVVEKDPLVEKLNALQSARKQLMEKYGDKNHPEVQKVQEPLNKIFRDKSFHLNVLTQEGEVGTLAIRYTAHEDLKSRLKELDQEGVDPINFGDGNGLFFDFKKLKDDSNRTSYKVDIAMSKKKDPETGKLSVDYLWSPLSESFGTRMEQEAQDLTDLFTKMTLEDHELVATLDDSKVVEVLEKYGKLSKKEDEGSTEGTSVAEVESSANGVENNYTTVGDDSTEAPDVPVSTAPKASSSEADDLINQFINEG